ncbi:Microtubule-associated tumor suppressor 1-like protein A, partial [Larimichthys crocea]
QDAEVGKVQTGMELTESNDNSVSVYLDANSDEYHHDTWNDNDNRTLALSLTTNSGSRGDNGDLSSGSSNRRRHGSSTPDSDATEIPADDDDDDEEEALFLSVSSDMGVRRRSTSLTSSTEQSGGSLVNPGSSGTTELQTEGTSALSVADERSELVLASEDLTESIQISSSSPSCANPTPDIKEVTSPPLEEVERGAVGLKPNTGQSARGAKTKPTTATSSAPRTAVSTPIKASSLEAKRVSKLDLKNVKAKVGSRSTPSPPKTPSQQNKCAPAIAKRAVPRKEDAQTGDGGKKQRSPGGPVRVAVVLKPIRGKSSNLKTNHKTVANDSAQLEKKESVSVSRTLSASTSSLGSDVVEEATPDSPRKAVQEETPEVVESSHPSEDAHEESVEDQREGTGKSLMTEAAVEKPRIHSKVSPNLAPPQSEHLHWLPRFPPHPTPNQQPISSQHQASPGAPEPTGTKPDERPSRSTLPVGSQSTAKPLISSTGATTSTNAPSEAVGSANSGVSAALKPPAMRSRALSLQARTTATGLKTPTVTNHNTAKTAAANQTAAKMAPTSNQALTKQASQYPLQRSGSARLSRLHSTVDKNKPREAPARPANSNSQGAAPAGGNNQNQQQPPPDPAPDVVNANAPVTPVLPAPATDATNTASGTTGVSSPGFKARTGSRSSPKTGSRLQNASKPCAAGAVAAADGTVTAKQNQSREQSEKKNQAINQLRKLLVQGNKKVEALATVIQHLFTEREEALKQKKELSLELSNVRDELVTSTQCCKHLQKEKEEVRASLEEALKRLEKQHKEELVEELRSRQEAERKNQEASHSQKMESLKLQYESSIQELKRIQHTDLENLDKTLKETESSLSEKISELCAEKEALNEKLKVEEERRKRILSDKNLKDSHTVYLEQELESLKVVLEIKNNQLHQKDKKLMEMDKLAAVQRTGHPPADAAERVQGQQASVHGERGAAVEAAQRRPAGESPPPLTHLALQLATELCLLPHKCTLIAQITLISNNPPTPPLLSSPLF